MKKKISKLLIGTNNSGKLREIRELLPKKIVSVSPLDFKIKSPTENGKTFKENAIIKAKYFSKKTNLICISDDSGLEIDLLNGAPGIFSARWAGKKQNFKLAIKKVFTRLKKKDKNWKKKKVKARFVCALSICYIDKVLKTVSESPAKAAIIAPTIITDDIAFVTDIKGVCNEGVTLQTT